MFFQEKNQSLLNSDSLPCWLCCRDRNANFLAYFEPILVDLQRGVCACVKVNAVTTCLSPLRVMCLYHMCSLWVTCVFRFEEPLVNAQALFMTDQASLTLRWHTHPWVLIQLSEQQRECWCSHTGGSFSDLQDERENWGGQSETECPQVKKIIYIFDAETLNHRKVARCIHPSQQRCALPPESEWQKHILPSLQSPSWFDSFRSLQLSVITYGTE